MVIKSGPLWRWHQMRGGTFNVAVTELTFANPTVAVISFDQFGTVRERSKGRCDPRWTLLKIIYDQECGGKHQLHNGAGGAKAWHCRAHFRAQ